MPKVKIIKESSAAKKSPNKKFRPLTEEEMIFGFGSKPTSEQLTEFFTRPDGKGIPLEKAFAQIRANIKKNREG